MSYQAIFTGWKNLTREDLIVAYRKAKADCFFENTFPTAINFADYEQDLLKNLDKLLKLLKKNDGVRGLKELLGECRVVPKKLSLSPKPESKNGHAHFSSPSRAFESIVKNNDLVPEFRIIGDFPVDSHILSALWINMVGHKFDACLSDSCYGARLKRVKNDDLIEVGADMPFHITSIGSFTPYFQPYQKWRSDGLHAIREELQKDRNVIAASIDLKSYYHFIDPSAISSKKLQEDIGLTGVKSLSKEDRIFTKDIADFLVSWAEKAESFSKKICGKDSSVPGGLVIGLTASRIISNVLLHRWDMLITEKVTPVHYGRYVDDMFLVLRDPGTVESTEQLMEFLQNRIGIDYFYKSKSIKNQSFWQISQGKQYQKKSVVRLQAEKQKLFVLQGRAGIDFLDSIEKEIHDLSSEHRLMPSPDQLEDSTAARVLSAAGAAGEQADTLRRADGLTIRRLSWSLQLRHVETLAHDLPANEWKTQRAEFYQFAHNHILRPDSLFAHYTYLPRLLGFAISNDEWREAEKIVKRSFDSINDLQRYVSAGHLININGVEAKATVHLWRYVKGALRWSFIDAAARYYNLEKHKKTSRTAKESRLAKLFLEQMISELSLFEDIFDFRFGSEDFHEKAPLLAAADLAREPYKRISKSSPSLISNSTLSKKKNYLIKDAFQKTGLLDTEAITDFLNSSRLKRLWAVDSKKSKSESVMAYLFPTRPYTPAEIAELAPECVGLNPSSAEKPTIVWAKYVRALRGVWVKPTLLATELDEALKESNKGARRYLTIGNERKEKVVIALTNIKTDDVDWDASACGKPNLSIGRYKRIVRLVNQVIRLHPKPDYALFPELSIPMEWLNSVAGKLSSNGISLIAGTEYRHFSKNEILSEACLVLSDNRLGFPTAVKIWQPKLQPAVHEDEVLTSKLGKTWYYPGVLGTRVRPGRPVYIHNGFYFGVFVCSELQNTKARGRFQGNVDALMVLSWNQDLDTFSALIEASALDVHAYTILVNNRRFGDSRVRSPAKESFKRDMARVRGGDNDFCVAVELDTEVLRAFQSRAKRWPQNNDIFKPVPEGFRILDGRRKLPAS